VKEIRYAVRRDYIGNPPNINRQWWVNDKDTYQPDWEKRRLFIHQSQALAIIWHGRAGEIDHARYRYVLVKVIRKVETEHPTATVKVETPLP
jgi:hypothetical protein